MSNYDTRQNSKWENDYIKCPRCGLITDFDDSTMDSKGTCCTACYNKSEKLVRMRNETND